MRRPTRRRRRAFHAGRRGLAGAAALWILALGCGREAETDAAPESPGPARRQEPARAEPGTPLNLVLITLDTTRSDALGCYGQARDTSPNIDRLAAEGVLFEQAVSSAPSTLPSHASILTGKYPYAHGARSNSGFVLSPENTTLAELLEARGYRTAAEIAAPVIGRRTQLDQGFGRYRDLDSFDVRRLSITVPRPTGPERVELPERPAGDITRGGLEFVRAHRDEPFFLWLHYFDPHRLHNPPQVFLQVFPDSPYHAEVLYADYQIGRVVSELTRLGLRKRTLVVVTADHGEGLGEHGEDSHSYFLYDTTVRVPLIFWAPGLLPGGSRVSSLVRTVDIAPTVLDLLGLPAASGTQGRSLRPLLAGEARDLHLTAYGESIDARTTFGTGILRYLREGRWKYVHKVNPQLFDVLADPGELRNLASEHPEVVERLRSRLYRMIAAAPEKPSGAEVPIDSETLAQLAALGYVGASSAPKIEDELSTLELAGSDPVSKVEPIRLMARAHGALKIREYERAAEMFRTLSEQHPESAPLLQGLIAALSQLDRDDEVAPLLRRAIELDPGFVKNYLRLARIERSRGNTAEAEELLLAAIDLEPCGDQPRTEYSGLLSSEKRYPEQIRVLEAGIQRCPDSTGFLNDYAYALATCPDARFRDGAKALRIARRVVAEGQGGAPSYLDTLAAAYAEVGEFEKAVDASRKAISLLQNRDMPEDVIASFRRNLETYRAGRPVREH